MRIKKFRMRKWICALFLFFLAALFLVPTVLTFTNSLMSSAEINRNYGALFNTGQAVDSYVSQKVYLRFLPNMISVEQYKKVLLSSPDYLLKLWNSVFLVVPIVLFQIIVACLAAYSFMRYQGKVRKIIFFVYLIIMLMPYQVTLVPNYLVADWLGILNTFASIILPGIFAPFSVFIITRYMQRIPVSYLEAARLDGANEWQVFFHICLPLCKGIIFSAVLLAFFDYWNMVEQPLILLSDTQQYPLSVFLSKINESEIGLAFAAAVIYMIPSILLFLYGEDYLEEGIVSSASLK